MGASMAGVSWWDIMIMTALLSAAVSFGFMWGFAVFKVVADLLDMLADKFIDCITKNKGE